MLTRFWQTVQLLTMVSSPVPVQSASLAARSMAAWMLRTLPHIITGAAFVAACQICTGRRHVLLLAVIAIAARMTGVL